jgi:hypothetical protein
MICLTAVIAVAGVIGSVIFNNQLAVMQGQLDEMKEAGKVADENLAVSKKAAEAAERAANVAEQTLRLTQGAEIQVTVSILDFAPDKPFKTAIQFENVGPTKALEFTQSAVTGFVKPDEIKQLVAPVNAPIETKRTLYPAQRAWNTTVFAAILTPDQFERINAGQLLIFVAGIVVYADVFGERKTRQFGFCLSGDNIKQNNANAEDIQITVKE